MKIHTFKICYTLRYDHFYFIHKREKYYKILFMSKFHSNFGSNFLHLPPFPICVQKNHSLNESYEFQKPFIFTI